MIPTKGRRCPHCRQPTLITRTSDEADAHGLLRDEYLECRNIMCAATFFGGREILRELSPPRTRNPAVSLPVADPATLRKVRIKFFSKDEAQEELAFEE